MFSIFVKDFFPNVNSYYGETEEFRANSLIHHCYQFDSNVKV